MLASKRKALSLLEIVVALVILSLTMMGMMSVFVSGKRHVHHVRSRMGGMQLGKTFLDPLQQDVRQDTWDAGIATNKLSLTSGNYTGASSVTSGSLTFSPLYNITSVGTTPELRKVRMQVNWTEPGIAN